MKWIKRLFCKHKDYDIVRHIMITDDNVHYYKKYIHRCKRCGKEW